MRLEYLGENAGGIPYKSNGRIYVGANNDTEKYVDALPEDVEPLVRTGRWRVLDGNTGTVVLEYTQPNPAPRWFNDARGTPRWQGGQVPKHRWITVSLADAEYLLGKYADYWQRVSG